MARKPASPSTRKTTRTSRSPAKDKTPLPESVVEKAKESGLMPHEILLKAARGEAFTIRKLVIVKYGSGPKKGQEKERRWAEEEYYPNFNEQVECARSAAPYFAPRLATQTVKTDENTADALTEVMKQLAGKLPG